MWWVPTGARSSVTSGEPGPGVTSTAARNDWSREFSWRSDRAAASCESSAALVHVADALEGPGVGCEPEQGHEGSFELGIVQGLLASEDVPEVGRFHEGGQDQIDEATLVAGAAPLVETLVRILVEGAIAAPEDAVELLELGELLRHPELAPAAEVGEDRELRTQRIGHHAGEALFELDAFGPLVIDRSAFMHQRR